MDNLSDLAKIILYTACAGACIPLGGLLARIERIRPRWLETEFRHSVIAFGGGVLLAAVGLLLIPEGIEYVDDPYLGVGFFLLGGGTFFAMESYLGARRSEKPQFTAMLLDYVPESLALGGAFAIGAKSAPLLALFIGLQNIPEGFNAYRELNPASSGGGGGRVLRQMLMLVPIGPVLGILGWSYFSGNVLFLGATMLFAAGGILYLIFQDIAPQAHMQRHWAPPLGAVLGFSVGMLGNSILAGG